MKDTDLRWDISQAGKYVHIRVTHIPTGLAVGDTAAAFGNSEFRLKQDLINRLDTLVETEVSKLAYGMADKCIYYLKMLGSSYKEDCVRKEILDRFNSNFCTGCGRVDPHCPCENDE